jgi:regulator of nucleoside diphosphate kinase
MATMTTAPRVELEITETDFDRLSQLVDSPRYRATHPVFLAGLRRELDRGRVVPAVEVAKGTVTMRSRVRVRDLRARESETFTLVYPEEADIDEGKVSVLAPLGMALLGARVGAVVEVNAPGGVRRFRVEEILYQPEAAGDLHL